MLYGYASVGWYERAEFAGNHERAVGGYEIFARFSGKKGVCLFLFPLRYRRFFFSFALPKDLHAQCFQNMFITHCVTY